MTVEPLAPRRAATALLTYREARGHALLLAILLWAGAAIVTFASPGGRTLADRLKGADFVQLYTLAHVAFEGPYPRLEDADRFHSRQVELVPASAPERYLPVYPPTAALLFSPLARVSYESALTIWTILLIGGYAAVVAVAWRQVRHHFPDYVFVAAAAAAFPPFWNLVLFGQTTIVPLVAFTLAWLALERQRPWLAGLALGLLSVKPQFAVVLAGVALVTGQWRLLSGGLMSLLVQAGAVVHILGADALYAYIDTMRQIPAVEPMLEPNAYRMHSVRSLTNLLPTPVNTLVFLAVVAWITKTVAETWRVAVPLTVRFGLLVLGSVLANPHLFVYDATVLVLPFLWLGGWLEQQAHPLRRRYWHGVYAVFLLFLFPTAALVGVQGSVLVLVAMFWSIASSARSAPDPACPLAAPSPGNDMTATHSVSRPQP